MEKTRPRLQLSHREQQLIQFASEGLTDTAIAHRLEISEATVGTYWGRIRIKIGPYSRTELVSRVLRAESEKELDDLRSQNASLVQELHSAARTSSEGEPFYQALIENAPDAMVLVDSSGVVEFANLAAHELFGYSPGSMMGLSILVMVPPRYREIHVLHRQEYMNEPQRRQMGEHLLTPAIRRDGTEFMIRAVLSAIDSPNGLVVTCAVRPVS